MYDFASGPSASASLLGGSEPPLSPETVGRPPSFLEAPMALRPIPAVMSTTTLPAPAPLPAPPALIAAFEPPSLVEAPPVETAAARLVVRMLGGEELELGTFDDRSGAIEAARSSWRASAPPRSPATGRRWTDASSAPPRSPRSTFSSRSRRALGGLRGDDPDRAVAALDPPSTVAGVGEARLQQNDLLAVELGDGCDEAGHDRT